jgi:hypothetical protein
MKVEDFEFKIEGRFVRFYHDTKTHRYVIYVEGATYTATKAKGEAIADFLRFFSNRNRGSLPVQ